MKNLETRDLSEQLYDLLLDRIVSCDLAPGEQLVDLRLAEEFGVSRTPVKTALNRLAAEGLVQIVPRRGTFVTRLSGKRLGELLDIRRIAEVYAVELAVHRVTAEELGRIRALLEEAERLLSKAENPDDERLRAINAEYHLELVRSSGNGALVEVYERLSRFLRMGRIRFRWGGEERLKAHDDHLSILEAVERRDVDGAKKAVTVHLEWSKRLAVKTLGCDCKTERNRHV